MPQKIYEGFFLYKNKWLKRVKSCLMPPKRGKETKKRWLARDH